MNYLNNTRLKLIYRLLGAKLDSSKTIIDYQNATHNYSGENALHMREAHFITALKPKETRTMSAVAEYLSVTQSAASQTAARLEKSGYVLRTHSEEDRRIVLVSLTPKGEEFYAEHIRYDTEQFQKLDDLILHNYTEEQLQLLVDYEEKMNVWFSQSGKKEKTKSKSE